MQKYKFISSDGKSRRLHRVLMERHLGRKLLPHEHVHHKNENKRDNRVENLEVMDIRDHIRLHHQKYPKQFLCIVCGKKFTPRPSHRGRSPRFCTKSCFGMSRRKFSDAFIYKVKAARLDGLSFAQIELKFNLNKSQFYQLCHRIEKH